MPLKSAGLHVYGGRSLASAVAAIAEKGKRPSERMRAAVVRAVPNQSAAEGSIGIILNERDSQMLQNAILDFGLNRLISDCGDLFQQAPF